MAESIAANHHGQAISGKLELEVSPLTRALRYPLCTISVLEAIHRICLPTRNSSLSLHAGDSKEQLEHTAFELPKRIFRSLGQEPSDRSVLPPLDGNSDPLPLLRLLWKRHTISTEFDHSAAEPVIARRYAVNSHGGYPLVRAVHAQFVPLIQFLLDHGADPRLRECMAVKVAIGKKDLTLVKMLIEFGEESGPGTKVGKKRRRLDRVEVTPYMLELAVRCDARDIVQYFVEEKGCIPNMKTLKAVRLVLLFAFQWCYGLCQRRRHFPAS